TEHLGKVVGTLHLRTKYPKNALLRLSLKRSILDYASCVNEDLGRAPGFLDLLSRSLHTPQIAHISLNAHHARASGLYLHDSGNPSSKTRRASLISNNSGPLAAMWNASSAK